MRLVDALMGVSTLLDQKIDFLFFVLSDRYTFQELSQKYLSRNL